MPAAHRVGWAQLRVGLMAIAGLVVIGMLVFLLTGSKKIWAQEDVLYTYMDDAIGLATGSPVRLNGILIGEVTAVGLSAESAPRRVIKITMEVERDMLRQIPVDSIAAVAAENVLGAKFINIRKGVSPTHVQAGAEIRSLDTQDFDEVIQQSSTLLLSLQHILKRVDAIVGLVESGKGSIGRLLVDEELYTRLVATVAEVQKISAAMGRPTGTIGKLIYNDDMYDDLKRSMGRVDSMLADLQAGQGTMGKFLKDEAVYTELRQTIGEVRKITADLNAGKGTAGKLLKDESLHKQLEASLLKVDNIIDRINAGQGTIGQLLVNPQMYDTLNGATAEMRDLVKAIRENPKKYLRIKLALF
jgi:phospholipid/cholesterol/gamma-HCH transport system substrate-binding protein